MEEQEETKKNGKVNKPLLRAGKPISNWNSAAGWWATVAQSWVDNPDHDPNPSHNPRKEP